MAQARFLILFGALAALVLWPFLANAYLPLEDLPNHIARRVIAAGNSTSLAEFYGYDWALRTNSAADLLYRILPDGLIGSVGFSRLTLGTASLSLVAATVVLHRVLFGDWPVWPLASAVLVFNAPFLWGFENFVLTVPVILLGLAFWCGSSGWRLGGRLAAVTAISAVLYIGHVFALLAFVLLVFSHALGRLIDTGSLKTIRAPELAILAALCLWHVMQTAVTGPAGYGSETTFGTLAERLEVFTAPFAGQQGAAFLPFEASGLALLLLWPLLGWLIWSGRLIVHPEMKVPLVCFGLATLLMPAVLSGVYLTHIRFPGIFLAVLLAATRPAPMAARTFGMVALALLLVVGARSAMFDAAARSYSRMVTDLREVARHLPPGARVLTLRNEQALPATRGWQLAGYIVGFSESFVPTLFVAGSHGLRVDPRVAHLTAEQPIAPLANVLGMTPDFIPVGWPQDYTHLLIAGPPMARGVADWDVTLIAEQGLFTLYVVP